MSATCDPLVRGQTSAGQSPARICVAYNIALGTVVRPEYVHRHGGYRLAEISRRFDLRAPKESSKFLRQWITRAHLGRRCTRPRSRCTAIDAHRDEVDEKTMCRRWSLERQRDSVRPFTPSLRRHRTSIRGPVAAYAPAAWIGPATWFIPDIPPKSSTLTYASSRGQSPRWAGWPSGRLPRRSRR